MTSSFIQTSDQQPFNTALNGNMDRTVLGMDVEKFWLNHPSLTHLDLLSPKGSPQLPEMLLSPTFQSSEPKAFLLSSPEPLLTLLSINQNSQDSPAGVPQTCFMDNGGQDVAKHDRNPSPLWHDYYSTRDCQGGAQNCNRESDVHAMTTSQEPDHPGALNKACDGSSQMQTNGTLEEGLRIHSLWNISQNAALVDQASRLQKRLLAMLGEHASRHYSHQREGLRRKLLNVSYCPKSPMASGGLFTHTRNEMFIDEEMQEDEVLRQIHQTREQSLKSRDLENLAQCGCAVLHGMLDALDSDATLSSSSDEDAEGSSAASRCQGCEWKWLKERAELCSRWTWLQMRLSELDSQIQQLGELHKQILANRGHVVLAETQPLTDRQIQHTLWTETMDLSFTAGNMQDLSSDVDMEPSSPTRLLRNIERQSAQLTQIVNSLMPPFCASPSSSPVTKRPCSHWRDHQKIAFGSQVQADTAEPVSLPNGPQCLRKTGQKRKRVCHRRKCPLLMDITSVSARTRPLLTYHKPRLFIMDPSSYREQALDSFRSLRHTCDPATVCTDPTCPHRKEKTASKVHPVLSLSSDTLSSLHLQNALKSDLLRSQNCLSSRCRASRSLFYCNHQPKNSRHLKNHRRESTLMRWACTRVHPRKAHREDKRKRRCSEWLTDVAHWSDVSSLSDENLLEECSEDAADCTPTQQRNSQIRLRSRSSESIFSIDDIVIPVSLVSSLKVERHQYKDILTPSWRKVDIFPLLNKEEDEQNELEPITDEDFRQRHQSYEHKESSWNLSRRHRLSRRRCSAVSVRIHPAHCHPTVDSSVSSTQTSSPPEGQTEACVDDREPVPPWKRRVFEDDEALRSDEDF